MKLYAKVIAILALPLFFVVGYALCPIHFPSLSQTLSKLDFNDSPDPSKGEVRDSIAPWEGEVFSDTTTQRILFFGDSMVEGLVRRMADYAQENGHELACIVWYSSTTLLWATSDTLQHFIQKYDPTFYMICIGGNEQFLKDLQERKVYIQHIINTIGGKPFVWIGIPTWKSDTGFNNMVQQCVGTERFFDSRRLTLKRGSDHVHPTFEAASMWMDSIAVWMQSPNVQHPIKMQKPTNKATIKYPLHLLQPVK